MKKKIYNSPLTEVLIVNTSDLLRPTDSSGEGIMPTPPGLAPVRRVSVLNNDSVPVF